MPTTIRRIAATALAASLTACATPGPPPRTDLQDHKVIADVDIVPDTSERRVAYAYEGKPKTIAFFPPAACRSISDVTKGDTGAGSLVHDDCGVLVTLLEEGAVAAGLEVVSWRNLIGDKRALDYAREANVDMLVEINELSDDAPTMVKIGPGMTDLRLFEHRAGGDVPLATPADVPPRCAESMRADWRLPALAINAKFVSVVDGRVRGNYRNKEPLIALKKVWDDLTVSYPLAEVPGSWPNDGRWLTIGAGAGIAGLGALVGLPAGLFIMNGGDFFGTDDLVIIFSGIGGLTGLVVGGGLLLYGLLEPSEIVGTYVDESTNNVCRATANLTPPAVDTRENRNKALERMAKDLVDVVVGNTAP